MRMSFAAARLIVLLASVAVAAQSPLEKARGDYERVRALVEAGALARKALEEAARALEEAADRETLERTLYGTVGVDELNAAQSAEMVAAAARLVERQQQELDKARRLVAEGALPAGALAPLAEELDRRRETLDLARERARLLDELAEMARAEEAQAARESALEPAGRFEGLVLESQIEAIRRSFEREFGRPLPISARGDTAVHRALGFDHRGRVDVALHPDQREGRWLLALLEQLHVPHFAFRSPVAGKSTGAHIHIGPPSERFKASD
jgi:hypothetical protein